MSGALLTYWELAMIWRIDAVVVSILNKSGEHKREATEADVADAKQRIRGSISNRRVVKRERKVGNG